MPQKRDLQTFVLRNLPATLTGCGRLADALPQLKDLTLAGAAVVEADVPLRTPGLDHLTIELPVVPRWIEIPTTLRWLSLRVPRATDDDLHLLLATCPEQLSSLGLRGTPVSDAVLAGCWPNLKV